MRDGAGRVGRPSPVRGGEGLGQERRCQAECWWPRDEEAPGSWRVQGGCWGRGGVAEMGRVSGIWTGRLGERPQPRRLGLGEGLGAAPGGRSGLQVPVDAERPASLCHLVPGAGPSTGGPCTRAAGLGRAPEVD